MKVILIVLDSVGIGPAPDAADYGDTGSATLPHLARAVGGVRLPVLERLGLGHIPGLYGGPAIEGVQPVPCPAASFGAMRERSQGKDTITGHWEIAGMLLQPGFHLFPETCPTFPDDVTRAFVERTGRGILGNRHGSGTAIIEELGAQSMREGKFIVYTSADSVFQIASHTGVIPLEELYRACEIARELCDPYRVGRVIARPFTGAPGAFERTRERRDYAYQPSEPTLLERLHGAGVPVYAVGKIEDIFAHRGITQSWHTGSNPESQQQTAQITREMKEGFVFANFIDFDMLHGHRRDPAGYARCLEQTDEWLAGYLPLIGPEDTLILTADHGNDPTFKGSDHTRELVPLLVHQPGRPARSLGVRDGFYDVAASVVSWFKLPPGSRGRVF
ncbi:MAG: phosphopentomutase [Kiritimatiellia bacterium]